MGRTEVSKEVARLLAMDDEARTIMRWALRQVDPTRKSLWMFGDGREEDFFHEMLLYMFKHPPPSDLSATTIALKVAKWMIGRRWSVVSSKRSRFYEKGLSLSYRESDDDVPADAAAFHRCKPSGELTLDTKDTMDAVREILEASLTERQASVILLLGEGMSEREVAAELGLSAFRVHELKHSARNRLSRMDKLSELQSLLEP